MAGRPKKTSSSQGLVPWEEVASKMNLPVKKVRAIYDTAMAKLHDELLAREDTFEALARIYHSRNDDEYR